MLLFQELRGMADSSSRKDIPASDAEKAQVNAHKTPDGAWAWIVCISGTLSVIITFGCSYNFGLFFPLLLDEFKEGKAKTGKTSHSLSDWHILTYLGQHFPDSTSSNHPDTVYSVWLVLCFLSRFTARVVGQIVIKQTKQIARLVIRM